MNRTRKGKFWSSAHRLHTPKAMNRMRKKWYAQGKLVSAVGVQNGVHHLKWNSAYKTYLIFWNGPWTVTRVWESLMKRCVEVKLTFVACVSSSSACTWVPAWQNADVTKRVFQHKPNGHLGHEKKNCTLHDPSLEQQPNPYGEWMKAGVRRRGDPADNKTTSLPHRRDDSASEPAPTRQSAQSRGLVVDSTMVTSRVPSPNLKPVYPLRKVNLTEKQDFMKNM